MNGFVTAVGVSYLPLHEEAVITAEVIGDVRLPGEKASAALTPAKGRHPNGKGQRQDWV